MNKKDKKKVFGLTYTLQDYMIDIQHRLEIMNRLLDELYDLCGEQELPDWARTREDCS